MCVVNPDLKRWPPHAPEINMRVKVDLKDAPHFLRQAKFNEDKRGKGINFTRKGKYIRLLFHKKRFFNRNYLTRVVESSRLTL